MRFIPKIGRRVPRRLRRSSAGPWTRAASRCGGVVPDPFLCPGCKENRTSFNFVFKLHQEVRKDPKTGEVVFESDELETAATPSGRPYLEVVCLSCGYSGQQAVFIKAAKTGSQVSRTLPQSPGHRVRYPSRPAPSGP